MFQVSDRQGVPINRAYARTVSILLWFAMLTGFAVSTFTVVEELCLATACRDTASFTFFGAGIGWFGIIYFSLILILLWLRKMFHLLAWALTAMVFSGIGAEVRLLWIQKFIIGSWCPLCVTICFALSIAAIALLIEKVQEVRSDQISGKNFLEWMVFLVTMIAAGLAIAVVGVKAL